MRAERTALALATVLAGLSAGFFFTYQASVVRALATLDDQTYVTTFQAINETVGNPAFAVVFFGTPPATAAALLLHRGDHRRRVLLGAGLALVVSVVAITALVNVPLNDDLATVEATVAADATTARAEFEDPWNRANLARAVASIAGAACLVGACVVNAAPRSRPTGDTRRREPVAVTV
ncbi:MAG: anthrone oxygenase family protein [Actinomycetota bacterium]|nr:anthrone oxygenase family protein [Actinomycetota bacterium]